MPAIASLEDLKAAQKEGLSIYAMRYACLPYRHGAMLYAILFFCHALLPLCSMRYLLLEEDPRTIER